MSTFGKKITFYSTTIINNSLETQRAPSAILAVAEQLEDARACEDTDLHSYLQYLCDFHDFEHAVDTESAVKLYHQLIPYV